MWRRTSVAVAAVLVIAALTPGTPVVAAQGAPGVPGCGPGWGMGWGPGRMMGPGMMGQGMYGPWWQGATQAVPVSSLDQVVQNVQAYVTQLGNPDLVVDEVMEFTQNYYAIVKEESTGQGAFELLVNKVNGAVFPEMGPNMMWNTKYGHMAGWGCGANAGAAPTVSPSVNADQAWQIAQQWLDQYQPGTTTEEPDAFYGYYTVHTLRDGRVSGMLSVNAYTGQVWYHTWHGAFIDMRELGG